MTAESTGPIDGGVPARRPDPIPEASVPAWLRAWQWWMVKSRRIAMAQNRGLAWMSFWIAIGPVAWVFRRTNPDPLDRQRRPAAPSAFQRREGPIHIDPQRIKRPF